MINFYPLKTAWESKTQADTQLEKVLETYKKELIGKIFHIGNTSYLIQEIRFKSSKIYLELLNEEGVIWYNIDKGVPLEGLVEREC